MKKIMIISTIAMIVMTVGFAGRAVAQTQSKGLYLTYNDFVNHKLSYVEDRTNPKGNRIAIHEFIGISKVTVTSNGQKLSFDKSKLFGYHDNAGNDYRFDGDKAYQIIDTTGFYLYSYDKLVQQGKGPKPTRVYYFSKKSNSELLPLTFRNIENVFSDNPKFRYMVEVASVYNVKADAYDNDLNVYKIKELYTASLK